VRQLVRPRVANPCVGLDRPALRLVGSACSTVLPPEWIPHTKGKHAQRRCPSSCGRLGPAHDNSTLRRPPPSRARLSNAWTSNVLRGLLATVTGRPSAIYGCRWVQPLRSDLSLGFTRANLGSQGQGPSLCARAGSGKSLKRFSGSRAASAADSAPGTAGRRLRTWGSQIWSARGGEAVFGLPYYPQSAASAD
jgi:hypothetical protein